MRESASALKSYAVRNEKAVVLLLPDALGGVHDPARWRATLVDPSTAVRVLLCVPEGSGHSVATMLDGLGVETEILLGPEVEAPPATTAYVLRAPPGTSSNDLTEFALALSDVVLVGSASEQSPLTRNAAKLGKPIIVPGDPLPALRPRTTVTHRLDPDLPGWHARGRRGFGRLEQAIMEAFAFCWLGWTKAGVAESRRKLWRCIRWRWRPSAYFAPGCWQELAPDQAARDASSKIVAGFDAMDRSASHGSYIHRDLVWIAHFLAAFAVLAAVAGHLRGGLAAWGIVEFLALLLVAFLVLWARRTSLQDRWTACRLGAEQLRIARMSLPLLVLPAALATSDKPPAAEGASSKEIELGFLALAEVKRVVREQGLPRLHPAFAPAQAAAWLHCIVADQVAYHHSNYHKLERAESRLRITTQAIFFITMITVLAHFYFHAECLLLVTAAGPAFAAALHGAGTRLGIVHRAALSLDVERELKQIDNALVELMKVSPSIEAWREVRRLAYEAAETMGRENTSWHGLVRRYRDELP